MIRDPILSNAGEWVMLSYGNVTPPWDGSIGHGGSDCSIRFRTAAERSYFVELDHLRNEVGKLNSEIHWLKTVHGANYNLKEVRAKNRAALAELA